MGWLLLQVPGRWSRADCCLTTFATNSEFLRIAFSADRESMGTRVSMTAVFFAPGTGTNHSVSYRIWTDSCGAVDATCS